jgi:hypothetical protein
MTISQGGTDMAEVTETGIGEYEVQGVTAEEFEHAREVFAGSISGIEGDAGTATGEATKLDYEYDRASGLVRMTVHAFPTNLEKLPNHIASRALRQVLARAFTTAAVEAGDARKPNHYGVYDYVIPTLTNNTRNDLQFSSQALTNGTLYSYTGTIASGANGELFEADSSKLSGTGVGGEVIYQLSDGTPLKIDFFLNTIWTHTFTAGFSGGNAGRYKTPDVGNTDPSLDGYTYLNPTITIAGI